MARHSLLVASVPAPRAVDELKQSLALGKLFRRFMVLFIGYSDKALKLALPYLAEHTAAATMQRRGQR